MSLYTGIASCIHSFTLFTFKSVKSWIEYVDYEMETKFDEGEPILEGGYSKLVEFLTTSLTGERARINNMLYKLVSFRQSKSPD